MFKVDVYSKLTGEHIESINNISGDDDYSGWINTLKEIKEKKLFSSGYLYLVTFMFETWVFTDSTLLARIKEIAYEVETLIYGGQTNEKQKAEI